VENIYKIILGMAFFVPTVAFGHGFDKPGPHGGAIQMPGAFHTEVVDKKNNSLEIFLLDMNFQNPSVKNSSLKVFTIAKGRKTDFECAMDTEKYVCKGNLPKTGKLHVIAQREKMQGNEAIYDIPVKPVAGGGM
jgi:hypothetical protein